MVFGICYGTQANVFDRELNQKCSYYTWKQDQHRVFGLRSHIVMLMWCQFIRNGHEKKIDGDWGSSLTTQDVLPKIDTCHWCPFSCPLYYLFYRPGHFSLFSGCFMMVPQLRGQHRPHGNDNHIVQEPNSTNFKYWTITIVWLPSKHKS